MMLINIGAASAIADKTARITYKLPAPRYSLTRLEASIARLCNTVRTGMDIS